MDTYLFFIKQHFILKAYRVADYFDLKIYKGIFQTSPNICASCNLNVEENENLLSLFTKQIYCKEVYMSSKINLFWILMLNLNIILQNIALYIYYALLLMKQAYLVIMNTIGAVGFSQHDCVCAEGSRILNVYSGGTMALYLSF